MRKEQREYISPLLHPPLNRLFISRPRLEPLRNTKPKKSDFADKPKPSVISKSDLERLNNYQLSTEASQTEQRRAEKALKKSEKKSQNEEKLKGKIEKYKQPTTVKSDAFQTIFLSRLPYGTNERSLRRELAPFGSISSVTIKKGFAFVEFERERDARRFVKENEEVRIEGRRAVVDVERARTVEGWLPRRLGGGLGGRNARGRDPKAISISRPLSASAVSSSSSSSNASLPPLHPLQPIIGRTQVEYDDI